MKFRRNNNGLVRAFLGSRTKMGQARENSSGCALTATLSGRHVMTIFSGALYSRPRRIDVRRFILPKLRLSEQVGDARCNRTSFTGCNSIQPRRLSPDEFRIKHRPLQISWSVLANKWVFATKNNLFRRDKINANDTNDPRQSRIPVILAITSSFSARSRITLLFSEKNESAKSPLVRRFYDDKMERYVRSSNATKGESL